MGCEAISIENIVLIPTFTSSPLENSGIEASSMAHSTLIVFAIENYTCI